MKKTFLILLLTAFTALLGNGIIVPLLPGYADSMGASGVSIGFIVAGYSASRAIIMPFIGRLSDRTGRRKLFIVVGLFLCTVFSLGYIWATNVVELIVVRVLHGIAAGLVVPIARTYVGDLSPEGEEATWMSYFNASFLAGIGVGPLLGGGLAEFFGINAAFLTLAGLCLLSFVGNIIFLPESKQAIAHAGEPSSYRKMFRSNATIGLISYRLIESMGRRGFFTFIPVLAGLHLGLGPMQIGIIIAANAVVSSLLQTVSGKIQDRLRINRRNVVIWGGIISIAYMVATPLAQNFWQLALINVIAGIRVAITQPATSAIMVIEGRKFGMGTTLAVFGTAMSAGMAIGPPLAGAMSDAFDINAAFYFAAAAVLAGSFIFAWFTRGIPAAAQGGREGPPGEHPPD